MSITIYEADNANFSNKAHMAARTKIYPSFFGVKGENISFFDTLLLDKKSKDLQGLLDGSLAIDRIIKIKTKNLNYPVEFTFQERFREPQYSFYQDITITEFNGASGMPSELYKIKANYFLYGYFDNDRDDFDEAIIINVPNLLKAITGEQIYYSFSRNSKEQTFLTVPFKELFKGRDIIKFHYVSGKYTIYGEAKSPSLHYQTNSLIESLIKKVEGLEDAVLRQEQVGKYEASNDLLMPFMHEEFIENKIAI